MDGDSIASTSKISAASTDEHQEDVTLSGLLKRSIASASDLLDSSELSSAAGQTQLASLLANLSLCASLVAHLQLLSANETIDEVSTSTLRCFLVPYYSAMLELQRRTKDYKSRIQALDSSKEYFEDFMRRCEDYEVVPHDKRKSLYMLGTGQSGDPARRREAKIAQYKEEKALKGQIEQLEARRSSRPSTSIAAGSVNNDPDDADDEHLRPLLLTQISYCYLRAYNELSSISTELELLKNAPNMSELPSAREAAAAAQDKRERAKQEEESTWRLDGPSTSSGTSPRQLIDAKGRPLRPFTILPSGSSASQLDTRLRLQSEVFGYSHRLPTMSIDEYLQLEEERGNILQGGGARNTEESKQEAADKKAWEEEEDNEGGQERYEAARRKKIEWDEYTDTHKKGEGNRMNRG